MICYPSRVNPARGFRSGFTPLVKADRLAAELGVKELYIKDDSANYPTLSYKDRVVSVALTKAFRVRIRHSRMRLDREPSPQRVCPTRPPLAYERLS